MIAVRRSHERGHANHGWLESYHTFSFAGYYDPRFRGFRRLLVLNQDRVQPGRGFGVHPHEDMEIISYVLEGALEHRDSMGFQAVLRPGEVQVISAGTGIRHSEHNPSRTEPVHFLQIWIVPAEAGLEPTYQQRPYAEAERRNALRLVASPDGRDGSCRIHQDAGMYVSILESGHELVHRLAPGRHAWLHVARGAVQVKDVLLEDGDGAAVSQEEALTLRGERQADLLLFDLA